MNFNQLATDSFTGTDNAELGANWDSGYAAGGALKLNNNRATPAATATDSYESYNAVSFPNDQYAEFTLSVWAVSNLAGVMLRAAAPSTESYYLFYTGNFSGTLTDEIAKQVAGSYTVLATQVASAWSVGNVFKGAVLGTGLYLFKNGTQILTASDSTHSAGRAGLYLLYHSSGSGDVFVDDWAAGEVTASGGTVIPVFIHHYRQQGIL